MRFLSAENLRPAIVRCVASIALAGIGPTVSTAAAADDFLTERLQPFLAAHCVACHGGDAPEGKLALDTVRNGDAIRADRARWGKVVEYLEAGIMPPDDQPRPTEDHVTAVTAWLNQQLADLDGSGRRDPGRVTIRRLNRAEYNNTVRDLLGVDFKPADDFPSDDVGYGFDNIGDVLSLPPILLEKYLAAAEKIADQAIDARPPIKSVTTRLAGAKLRSTLSDVTEENVGLLYGNGNVSGEVDIPGEGEYLLRVRASAQQAGPDPARMTLRVDDKEMQTFDVRATTDRPEVFEAKVKIVAGAQRVAAAFLNDYYEPGAADPAARDRNLLVDYLEVEGPLAGSVQLPESHRRILFRQPKDGDERQCASEIVRRFASRAYRRPVTDVEVARLVRFVELARENDERFERGIQLAVEAVLVSPHFLFRVELDGPANAPVEKIDDYQLAARLSYFLWSSLPDDELTRAAAAGELSDRDHLAAQVKRMLVDPKSRALVENFAGQWLQLRNLSLAAPDRAQFKTFDDGLRAAMLRETEMLFECVLHEDRSVLDFLDADFTFVNETLAKHYDIAGVEGADFRRVSLPGDRRGGLLTHASILTITSNPTRTSPVKRGKWILEQILGTPPPPPPPGVPELEQVKLSGTLRQKMEQHRANPSCATCHARMDPIGFAFENFDPIGRWRDKDGEDPIDPSGTLPGAQNFAGARELRAILRGKPEPFVRNLARKLLTYAVGRGLEAYDGQAVNEIAARVAKDDYKFSSLVLEVVASEPFRMRRGKGAAP